MDLKRILRAILDEYALPWDGDHGVSHWARVLENGRRLCEKTSADVEVVTLFAVFHDSKRINELTDPNHGLRAAEFARTQRGKLFDLSNSNFELLFRACAGHTHVRSDPHITVQTCFDADRLDLGRVGIRPDPQLLCTEAAMDSKMINWSDGRAQFRVVPPFVVQEWEIALGRNRSCIR